MAAAWEDDAAAAFPRGGGGALSGLEHRRIAAEARRDAEEEILAFAKKKGGKKRDRAETETDETAARTKLRNAEGGRLDTLLRSKELAKGSLLLGAVSEVNSTKITLQLPGRLKGTVAREEVSDELRAAIQDDDLEHLPDLRKMFKLGEVLSVAVLAPPPPPSDDKRFFKRPAVELSMRLSLTQAASVDGDAANAISAGSPLFATLSSVEAHGAIMSIGGHPSGAFLHKKHWSNGVAPPRWRPVLLAAVSPPQPRRPLQLCAANAQTLRPPPAEAPIGMASLTAGSLLRASVVDVEEGGLRLQIADLFEASVDVDNTPVSSRDWASAFSRGQRVVARVLWVLPHSKRVGCSLRPHLTQCMPAAMPTFASVGSRLRVTVEVVMHKRALLRCTPAPPDDAISGESNDAADSSDQTEIDGVIASLRDVTDLEKNQSAVDAMSNLKQGQKLDAIVLGVNWLEARTVVSTRKSVVERKMLYDISELQPGQVVSGTIVRLDARGAKVRVGFGVYGRVNVDNLTDQKLTKPQGVLAPERALRARMFSQKRFKAGETHKCLVLECKSSTKKLILSMKPALVNSTLPRITKFGDCVPGVLSHGVVTRVRPTGLSVAFLNGVRGVVFGSELRATLGAVWESDPDSCYSLGQTVRCRVVRPHENKKPAQLSLLTEEEANSTPSRLAASGLATAAGALSPAVSAHPFGAEEAMALSVGEGVRGVVARVCDDGGIWVKLSSTNGHAYLPTNHLTDTVALEPIARAALRVGTPLPPLMVLMKQKKHQRGAGKVTVTAKPSLLSAHASNALPSSAEQASTSGKVLAGYVYKISAEGCVVGFLGGLRGFCGAAHVADGLLLAPARLLQLGQTVRAAVLPKKDGGVSKEMLVVSLLASDCGTDDSGAANGEKTVADTASAKGKKKSKNKSKNKSKDDAEAKKRDSLSTSVSAFTEPWRVAAMRASAERAAEGAAEEGRKGHATMAEAEAAIKALGISLPEECVSTLNAVSQAPSLGSVVQLEVVSKPKHADESPTFKALIGGSGEESAPFLQAVCAPSKAALGGRSKWKVGEKLSAVLIDVDPLSSLLTVSAQAELLAAAVERAGGSGKCAKGAQAQKAKQGAAAAEVAKVPGAGQQVQFQVLLVKPGLVVGCLPNHGFAVCVAAPHPSWHWAGMKAAELAIAAGKLAVHEVVPATVISYASATQIDDALAVDFYAKAAAAAAARAPVLVSLAVSAENESALLSARAVASSSGAEPQRLRSRDDAKVGAHAKSVVTSVGKESLRVRLDKKGFAIGHLHFTEVAEPGQDAAMPKVAVGETLHVVLLSKCDENGKTSASVNNQAESGKKPDRAHFALSVRPSTLAGGTTRRIVSAAQLKVGQQVDGWVKFVGTKAGSGLWVALSESVSGYVSSHYVRDDAPHGAAMQDHFKYGQAVHARVLELPTEKDGVSTPLKLTLRDSIASKRKAPEPTGKDSEHCKESAASAAAAQRPAKKAKRSAADDAASASAVLPSVGSVVSVTIKRSIPGVGYEVSLDDSCVGRVHVTEVVDEWVESPLSRFKMGATTEAVVIGTVNVHANLTLRKSMLAEALSQPEALELKEKHARPASAEEIAEGQLVRGYVKKVTERGVFLSLSRTVDAFVGLKFVSEDFVKADKLAERLPVGQLVVGRVITRAQPATSSKPSTLPAVSLRLGDVKGGVFKQKIVFADLHPGMVVSGIVRRIVDFGVFVRLAGDGERLDALCHVSELVDGKVKDAQNSFEIGSLVKAVVLKTDPEKKQISISLKPSRLKELGVEAEDDASDDGSEADGGDQEMAKDDSAPAQNAADSDEEEEASDMEMEMEGDDESFDELDISEDADDSDVDESANGALELDDDDGDDAKPSITARAPRATVPRKLSDLNMPKSSLSVGFEWDDFAPAVGAKGGKTGAKFSAAEDEDEADVEEAAAGGSERRGRRGRRAAEAQSVRQREAAIAARESTLLQADGAPQTAEDFERLLVGAPSSSMLWVQYMQHQLALAEVERAKEVGERALKSIDVREESERFNIWVALLNLELAHGDSSSLGEMFRRASAGSSPIPIYLHMASAHERAGDGAAADGVFTAASKKFRSDKRVWLAWLSSLMRRGQHETAKELLQRTVDTLPKADHVEVLSKYAQLEFRYGLAERGRTVFDGMLSSFPKRVDVWSVYIDMELREKDDAVIRRLFERVVSLKLSSKKIKFFFGRYLAYARSINDADLAQHVKEAARAWVEKATATETS